MFDSLNDNNYNGHTKIPVGWNKWIITDQLVVMQ